MAARVNSSLAPPDGEVKDIASLQSLVRDWMAANDAAVSKVNLILGFGYDNATLAEQRHPTRDDLDQISKDVPILLVHQSGHIIAVNSKAIEVAGITADTPDPRGGVIVRKPGSQEPNGVFEELAAFPILMKLVSQVGPEGFKAFARAGAELWARYGYTTADEGRSVPGTAQVLRQVADEGGFKIDVATCPDVLADKAFIEQNLSSTYRTASASHARSSPSMAHRRASPPGATARTTRRWATIRRATLVMRRRRRSRPWMLRTGHTQRTSSC